MKYLAIVTVLFMFSGCVRVGIYKKDQCGTRILYLDTTGMDIDCVSQ